MPRDPDSTRARILDAAGAEFAAHGLAGARVDRIAAASRANKQSIYAYFGSKERLFDTVVSTRVSRLADLAPFTPEDLSGYAGALFDSLIADPDVVRLVQWSTLQRRELSSSDRQGLTEKVDAIAHLRGIDREAALEILMLVLAAANAWFTTPAGAHDSSDAGRRSRHRAALVRAVDAMADSLTHRG